MAWATAVVAAMSLAVFPSLRLLPAQANYEYLTDGEVASPLVWEEPALPDRVEPAPKPGPSKVAISGADYSYTYTVNGRRQRIHGLGYNVMYSHLSAPERSARYDRDFAQMKAAGVNTILGWEREQFDEVTLEKAQEYDLGVVLPYHLPRSGAYADPAYQQMVRGDMEGWVKRFRGYPALRMWGIGNEVIHGMGKNPNTPQARAFAQFYVELADRVRALDPDHPVVYRDAEDIYVGPMREALKKDGVRRPWFVYGTNFFTFRICEVLRDWRQRGLDVPLLVSEFAPSGLARQDRPKGYLKMWRCIREQPDTVLGGFAYVWTTNGPEAIDRVLGLVDGEGQAVDGSLAALGRAFPWDGDNPP